MPTHGTTTTTRPRDGEGTADDVLKVAAAAEEDDDGSTTDAEEDVSGGDDNDNNDDDDGDGLAAMATAGSSRAIRLIQARWLLEQSFHQNVAGHPVLAGGTSGHNFPLDSLDLLGPLLSFDEEELLQMCWWLFWGFLSLLPSPLCDGSDAKVISIPLLEM